MNSKMVNFFDSTYLKTKEQANISSEEDIHCIKSVVLEAIEHQFKLVMIRSGHISFARQIIAAKNSQVLVGTVIDFPSGT